MKPVRVEVETEAEVPKVFATNHSPTPSPVPVTAPQTMLPEESVVRALAPEQVPNLPSVVVPVLEMEKRVVVAEDVDEATANKVVLVEPLFAWTESVAKGEVVAMPTLPEFFSTK